MTLPTVKYPTFTTTIPSTNQLAKFRPFIVAEEKILLMAAQAETVKEMTRAMVEVLEACFFNQVEISTLPSFDIEFLFLQVRSKSVNEKIELIFTPGKCKGEGGNCGKQTKLSIDVSDIKVQQKKEDGSYGTYNSKGNSNSGKKIILSDGLGITIKYPNMEKLAKSYESESEMDQIELLISSCISSVFDEENVYTDFSQKEMIEWYNTLTSSQRAPIITFIQNIPVLRYELKHKCKTCGAEEEIVFEGLKSFL